MASQDPRNQLIFISDRVTAVWDGEVTHWCQRETGGMVLGYETVSDELVLVEATHPGPNAKKGWLHFEGDHNWDRRLIAELYERSGRLVTYLGEWHSHSFDMAKPSRTDLLTIRRIADYPQARVPFPLSAIVVRSLHPNRVRWETYRLNASRELERLPSSVISSADLAYT